MGHRKWSDADLSAYLDGQLSPDKAQALESALQDNQELKVRLEGFQDVAMMVRALPAHQAPRNFLLTPAMVEQASPQAKPAKRYRAPLFMRVATTAVAAAFIVTMGLNVYLSGAVSPMTFALQDNAVPEMSKEEAPLAMMAVESDEAAPTARDFEAEMPTQNAEPEAPKANVETDEDSEVVMEAMTEPEDLPDAEVVEDDSLGGGLGAGGDSTATMGVSEFPTDTLTTEDNAGEMPQAVPTATADGSVLDDTSDADGSDAPAVDAENVLTPEPEIAIIESTATPPSTRTPIPERPQETPLPLLPANTTPGSLQDLLGWLPWVLGSATLLLTLMTLWLGRRRR